jgi:hypothetical protein
MAKTRTGKPTPTLRVKPGAGRVSRNALYMKASSYAIEAIEVLVDTMRNGDNSSAKTGAAKTILNKCLPDLKAIEYKDEEGNTVPFTVVVKGLVNATDNKAGAK